MSFVSCGFRLDLLPTLQISCAPFSPAFSDKSRLSNFFQMLPSDVDNAQIFSEVIFHYGWRKVALIVQDEIQFTAVRFTGYMHVLYVLQGTCMCRTFYRVHACAVRFTGYMHVLYVLQGTCMRCMIS